MPLSLGGLGVGLAKALSGYGKGKVQGEQLNRERAAQAVQLALSQARLEELGREEYFPIVGLSGDVFRIGRKGGKVERTGANVGRQVPASLLTMGLRPPTQDQTRLADFGTRILEGHAAMSNLERQFPGIGQRVDAKARPLLTGEKFGAVGSAIATALQPAIVGAMTPEEQAYWSALQDVVNSRLRRASGAQINKEELEREGRPLVPLAGEGEASIRKKQARRLQAALLYIRGAGNAFQADLLSPEAQAVLTGVVPQAAPAPMASPVAPAQPRALHSAPVPGRVNYQKYYRP